MTRTAPAIGIAALGLAGLLLHGNGQEAEARERLMRHRNLGKAFYENPTTQVQAVDEFRKALELAPDSARERVNYGLALLRAGKTEEGIAELEKAQKRDPAIPHTWFNLGIAYKKDSQYDRAIQQFEGMLRLVPNEPVSHYNAGVLYKLTGHSDAALPHFETAARLDPNLAGPHFQLYNAYRQASRAEDAAREEKTFQELKKRKAGAAIPEDLEWSFYAEIYETIAPSDKKDGDSPPLAIKLQARKIGGGIDAATAGMVVADIDGRGHPDLIVWSRNGVRVFKNGSSTSSDCGLAGLRDVISIAPGDFNNDGLTDLAVLSDSGAQMFVNRNGVFEKFAASLPSGKFVKAVWLDYDHDYDLDLFLLGDKSALMRNNGKAGFSDETASFPFAAGKAIDGTLFDTVPDTDGMDLVVAYSDRPGVLYRDKLGGRYEAQDLPALPAGSQALVAFDFNNDSWTDLTAATKSGIHLFVNRGGKLEPASVHGGGKAFAFADFENRGLADLAADTLYRNQGQGRFAATKAEELPAANAIAAADFDGDGRVDLAVVTSDGNVSILRNETQSPHHWLALSLAGVKNLRLAAGAEVEVKAGTLYQKQIYRGVPLLFGMGPHAQADTVRITWPNGLVQNQPKQPAGKAVTLKEAPRLSGSCPMIFTWNGQRFEFLTDVLGVAPLGASAGNGQYFPTDHDEYVQIPGRSLALENGRYEIRITEELREVSYLDQVKLIAVDHPAAVEIFTNDKFKAPPFPDFRLFGVKRRIYPESARDHHGRDVLGKLLRRDRRYADGFSRDYAGVAERHYLDLDFGAAARDNRAVLILNGWVDWADGSTFLASAQESKDGLVLPYLQVKDAAGQWRTAIEDMGIPAGKPKTIAVDLTGKFLSSSREVRIVTNLCVYWDEIFLSEDAAPPGVVMTAVEAQSADLGFRGFSKPWIDAARRQPETFDYARVQPASSWNPTPGRYTRYGDVRPLIESVDDRMAILGSGDELKLRFDARRLPKLPEGWTRDFLLFVDGWAKDADANTAFAKSVEPLPFHGMSAYPYKSPERYLEDEAHRSYQEQYNTRPALKLMPPLIEGGSE